MANPLYDCLIGKHRENADVFLHLETGGTQTFAEFVARSGQFASALKTFNLNPGDRVALQVEKSPDALALCAACIQLGLIFLPLNPAYTASEITYFVQDSGAKMFVAGSMEAHDFGKRIALTSLHEDGRGQLSDIADACEPLQQITPREDADLAAFLYTSGTTGRSKGAMLSQANLLSNAETLADYWKFTKDDCLLHALPIFHTHGLFVATNTALLAGARMIFMSKFEVDKVIDALPKATTMMGVPTFYTRLLSQDGFTRSRTKNMRLFISGSAPLLSETHHAFTERTGHKILERYGMTETNMNTSNPYEAERKAGTVGLPLPGIRVRVVDQNSGAELPSGEIGILEVKGPNVFQGYWNMPEKTAEEFRDDGYFITGDLVQIDEDGYITIVGRSKDLIISGGFNIYPKEIEELIDDEPSVLESAVIGLPHPDMGEAVVGIVVASDGEVNTQQILTDLSAKVARFKIPRKIIQIDALPRNTMGKVQKAHLRKIYADALDKAK